MIYAAGSVSLAALELFVHLEPEDHPDDLVLIPAEVPDDVTIRRILPAELPAGWRAYPAPSALQDLGTEWARNAESLVLALPSAMVPSEENYLINPAHHEFARVIVGEPEPFHFDPRMWN